jgi:DNA polymerase-3 subunit epsilon
MNKIFWFDVETTGLDEVKQDIITLAFIVDINGQVKAKGHLKIQPTDWDAIQDSALEVNKITREQLKTFQLPAVAVKKLNTVFGKFVDKFDKKDKIIPAGYNVDFDLKFLREFYSKQNDKYLYSWLDYHKVDPMQFVLGLRVAGHLRDLENVKLETVAKYLGIEIQAHDALSDITVTREVYYKLLSRITFKGAK